MTAIHWKTFQEYHNDFDIVDVAVYEYIMFLYKGAKTPYVNLSIRNIAILIKCTKSGVGKSMQKLITMGIIKAVKPVSARKSTGYQVLLRGILNNLGKIYKLDKINNTRIEYLLDYLKENIAVYDSPVTFDLTPRIRNGKFSIIDKSKD